jgi:DNA-directed RNA polymerase subunit RPC12/RpoP
VLALFRLIVSAVNALALLALLLMLGFAILKSNIPASIDRKYDGPESMPIQSHSRETNDTKKDFKFKAEFGPDEKKPEPVIEPSTRKEQSPVLDLEPAKGSEITPKPAAPSTPQVVQRDQTQSKTNMVQTMRFRLPCGRLFEEAQCGSTVTCPSCGQQGQVPTNTDLVTTSSMWTNNKQVISVNEIRPVQKVRVKLPCGRVVDAPAGANVSCPTCGKGCVVPRTNIVACRCFRR